MKRNCELELGLQPRNNCSGNSIDEPLDITQHHPQVLHNGCHCFIDVTELQARVIIWLASREMEGPGAATSSSWVQSQALMCGGGGGGVHGGLSLKKSLHSFLQKRKKRTQQQKTNSQCDDCE